MQNWKAWISEQEELRRSEVPVRQTGAVGKTLARWDDLFTVLEAHPALWERLRASELFPSAGGRPRNPGEWGLAYLAYANSIHREMTTWLRDTEPAMWLRIGFAKKPGYQAVYEHFRTLEGKEDAFRAVAAALVRIAVERSDGKVGHAIHVDGTEAETHARLRHDCTSAAERRACRQQRQEPSRSPVNEPRAERHRLAAEALETEPLDAPDSTVIDQRGKRTFRNGCWYRILDADAGVRAYTNPKTGKVRKFWAGYYHLAATDHYTGGVLATLNCSATVNEHIAYPELYERVKNAIGGAPVAVVADRGFAINAVYAMHTRDGVATVIPWRKQAHEPVRVDHDRYDRHGIPTCNHCKGDTSFTRFAPATGPAQEPRLWFQCNHGCPGVQSIYCKENWRMLLPVWRTSAAYQVLRKSHDNYEHTHDRWRERYCVAGNNGANRPKRLGIGVQQLRSSAALVIEWFTILYRQGWIGDAGPINTRPETRLSRAHAAAYTDRIRARRHDVGLSGTNHAGRESHQREVARFRKLSADGSRRARATVAAARGEPE